MSVEENSDVMSATNLDIRQTDVITICGRRGSGKSNLAKTIIRFLLNSRCPVIIIDPLQEHRDFQGAQNKFLMFGDQQGCNNFIGQLIGKWKGILVIDEADGFFPNRKILLPWQKYLVHLGRHYGIGIIFITRRLANLHTDCIAQTSKLFSFRLFAGADANYLSLMQLDELIEPIWNLEKFHFVFFDGNTGELAICPPIPKY